MPFSSISISLSPNVQKDDVWLVTKLLFRNSSLHPPSYPKRGESNGDAFTRSPSLNIREGAGGVSYSQQLEQKFKEYLSANYAFSFNSGRSALYTIMKALDIKEGDEVLLQAFTCNAVPNPVLWAGGTPVYVDIDDTLNINPSDLEKKITPQSRAVIIQHTFGVPAQVDKILEIARRHSLLVIEDCAHALGAKYNPAGSDPAGLVGTFGDVAFFSFGRDKVISSVWGGMVTTNDDVLAQKIEDIYKDLPAPSSSWTMKQILHPLLFSLITPTYYMFGKYLLAFLRIVRGIGLAVSQKERMGERPLMFPAKMPEALAQLALHQFDKLEMYNEHRREIAGIYSENLIDGAIYLRFNARYQNAKDVIAQAKRKHILLGDWYKNIIDPAGTDFAAMRYTPGSCPNADRAARESVNLPTHINISQRDAKRIVDFLAHKS